MIDVHMDQCNKTGTPEIDEHVHGQLIVNKDINATQQRKTFQQMVPVKCLEEVNEPQPHTRITCYSLLKWFVALHMKAKNIKLLE